MRGLAKALGVEPMSLYHWFPSRDHLMDALLDSFLSGIEVPQAGTFSVRLRQASRAFRVASQTHPGLVPYVVVHRFNTRVALRLLDELLGIVALLHSDPWLRAAAFRLYIHWLIGFCLDEAAGFSKGPSAQSPPTEQEIAVEFGKVAELGPFNRPAHFDELFEQGLTAILRGMRVVGTRKVRKKAE
jgi:AcrR family transcriptional regulator